MPDIQSALKTALSKTLQTWDDEGTDVPVPSVAKQPVSSFPVTSNQKPVMKNLYNITNNVSRETFKYIKENPGSTRMEIIKALEHQGFGKASVSSLIAQMRRSSMVHDTNGLWYADVDEYQPIKNSSYKKKKKATPEKKGTTGIGALLKAKLEAMPMSSQDAMDAAARAMGYPDHTPPIVPTRKGFVSIVRNREPQSIIDNMTVYQARELYDHLKQLFGG
jgi:hypothetical protein